MNIISFLIFIIIVPILIGVASNLLTKPIQKLWGKLSPKFNAKKEARRKKDLDEIILIASDRTRLISMFISLILWILAFLCVLNINVIIGIYVNNVFRVTNSNHIMIFLGSFLGLLFGVTIFISTGKFLKISRVLRYLETKKTTHLLFPYICKGFSEYDTGVCISNMSAQFKGTCNIYFFGNEIGMDRPIFTYTTPVINHRSQYANIFSAMLPAAIENFRGFAIAECNFPNAIGVGLFGLKLGTANGYGSLYLAEEIFEPEILRELQKADGGTN